MICPNQSNRGPLKEKKKLKCGSLPTADIVGAVGKMIHRIPNMRRRKKLEINICVRKVIYSLKITILQTQFLSKKKQKKQDQVLAYKMDKFR